MADDWAMFARVVLAGVLGGLIGVERELADKPAGLRTHILVASGSALLVLLTEAMILSFGGPGSGDPSRSIQAIVIGISFLGTGTIVRREQRGIEGLTTAASIFVVSAIGVAVAIDRYLLATLVTAMMLVVLVGLGLLEGSLDHLRRRLRTDRFRRRDDAAGG